MKKGSALFFIMVSFFLAWSVLGWGYSGGFIDLITPIGSQSLGNGGSGIVWGLDSMGLNPAGLAGVENLEVNMGYLNYLNDFKVSRLSIGLPTVWGVFAIDYSVFQSKKWPITTEEEPFGTGEMFFEQDSCLSFGYGRRILKSNIYAGIEIKKVQMKLYKYSSDSILFSFGIRFYNEGLGFGISAENLGGKVKFISEEERIEATYRLGFGLTVFRGKGGDLDILFDMEKRGEATPTFIPGFIFYYGDLINFNAGYRIDDGENGISTGLGFSIKAGRNLHFVLDLVYSDVGVLGEKNGAAISVLW
ncbi:MAG TPA: hypothetical protein ENN73_03870 [Firmicutes bacterium]|nr:hypothetical protein [Bacillota bacterium]